MKKTIALLSTVLITVFLVSCNNNSTEKERITITKELAGFECRAFQLRNERFKLADKMRFLQDSISSAKSGQETDRLDTELKAFAKQKDSILTASLQLADSIKNKTDYIISHYLTDKEKEQQFNRELDELLTKNGCK